MAERLLKKSEVCDRTSLSYPTIWRRMRRVQFPRAVQLSPGRIGWRESEIQQWIEKLAGAK